MLISVFCIGTGGNVILHHVIRNAYDEKFYYSSDAYMYSSFVSSYASLQKFGFYGYYFEDACRRVFPILQPDVADLTGTFKYEAYSSILNDLCKDHNVVMIYAESFDLFGISKELTPLLYSLKKGVDLSDSGISKFYNVSNNNHSTSISRKDFNYNSQTNEYTFNNYDIYDNLTLNQVGLELSNHFANESTDVSELKALTSNYDGGIFSLPQMLNEDYQTNYIHGNHGHFYSRYKSMKSSVGFENTRFFEDMSDFAVGAKQTLNCFTLDSETIKHYTDNQSDFPCLPTDEKFFTFFMTITTHGEYDPSIYLNKNYPLVDAIEDSPICESTFNLYKSLDPALKKAVREYFARVLDTEYALAYLINYLHENNILNKTIISFTGDHSAYSNSVQSYKKLYANSILGKDYSYTQDVVEGFIYSTSITQEYLNTYNENRVITHLTDAVDLLPTILTLLGKTYNQNFYLGTPVINKSLSRPAETVFNPLYRSFFYGKTQNNFLSTYNGIDISVKNPDHHLTKTEKDKFINDYNYVFFKYDYSKKLRANYKK